MRILPPINTASLMLLLGATLILAGCGIKPGSLTSPEGKDSDTFPRTYPAPSTIEPTIQTTTEQKES